MSETKDKSTFEIVVGVATIIAAIAFLVKIFGRSEADKSRDELYKSIKPNYTDFQYSDWADILETALKEGLSEDEDAVYAVFQRMRNISDLNKLIQAFGRRRTYFSVTTGIKWTSLPEMIHEFFNSKEINHVNDILKSKGISYRF